GPASPQNTTAEPPGQCPLRAAHRHTAMGVHGSCHPPNSKSPTTSAACMGTPLQPRAPAHVVGTGHAATTSVTASSAAHPPASAATTHAGDRPVHSLWATS